MKTDRYDELARTMASTGLPYPEYEEMLALKELIVKARRPQRPFVRLVESVFNFFQFRISDPLIEPVSERVHNWLWERLIAPVVNNWAGRIRESDTAKATPAGYAATSCCICGKDTPSTSVYGCGDPMIMKLCCGNCALRALLSGFADRVVQ